MDAAGKDWKSPLDPDDWAALRRQGHAMLDDMLDHLQGAAAGSGPTWRQPPAAVRASLREPFPATGMALEQVHAQFLSSILPYSVGNTHPGFMGWVHGAGTPVGMLAEMLAAGLNANLGGRDHMPVELERQVVRWIAGLFDFPEEASGLFVTGSSMANLIGVLVARRRALGAEVRTRGVQGSGQTLVAYAVRGTHGCVSRGMDMAGLGSANLRLIDQLADGSVDVAAMRRAIEADLRAGLQPFLIVGTAGSVDIGCIDDLHALADLAAAHRLHFHVDGAIGALCMLSPQLAPKFAGIERADSIAMDFHKWMHVPYDAGFILVRSAAWQIETFADLGQSYLAREPGGMSAGTPWPCDLGPDLSRGFRALKVWMSLKVLGADRLGQAMSESCERARYLAARISAAPELELMAPVALNIVCFRYRTAPESSAQFNARLLREIQLSGIAAPSSTRVRGEYVIRTALMNHRTGRQQLDALVDFTIATGRALQGAQA